MTATSPHQELPLLPAPSRLDRRPGAFVLDAETSIVLGAAATPATLFAASHLQSAIHELCGLRPALRKAQAPASGDNRIALLLLGRDEAQAADLTAAGQASRTPEGYHLLIEPRRITLVASTEAGLFYAVQTLRQILHTQGRHLPALAIDDQPALAHRGLMLDISRGKVPTLETLCWLAETLGAYKYNQLQLYTEHTFVFPSHPQIGAGSGSLSAEDILHLDRVCQERHIELVPNLQSFGHLRSMLRLPAYAQLDEVGWQWSVAPAREETYHLFETLYADLLPNFTSRWLNIDCDETWDLATGQSRALAEQLGGPEHVYLHHVLRLRELAGRFGRRIMMWADILNQHPELLGELPEDVLLLDWTYEARDEYPTARSLGATGREFWVCPGTSSWNTLFPRLDNALGNIRTFTQQGIANGARGMLLTDWGDHGHYQLLSLSAYPYLFGAATAWTGAQTEPEAFDRAFGPLFLDRPAGDASLASLRRLGRAVVGPSLAQPNASNSARALFEDPLGGRLVRTADADALVELGEAARAVQSACSSLPDTRLRHDVLFVADQVAFAADKVLLGQRIRGLLGSLDAETDRAAGLAALDGVIGDLAEARERLRALTTEFEQRWLASAHPSEIHLTLERYQRASDRYAAALAWLAEQRRRYAAGEAVDTAASSYDVGDDRVLWEEGRAQLVHLADLVGPDNLAPDIRRLAERWRQPATA